MVRPGTQAHEPRLRQDGELLGREGRIVVDGGGPRREHLVPATVERVIGAPHFREPLAEALGRRTFDVVVATYQLLDLHARRAELGYRDVLPATEAVPEVVRLYLGKRSCRASCR